MTAAFRGDVIVVDIDCDGDSATVNGPANIPGLDEIAADRSKVSTLTLESVEMLLAKDAAVHAALVERLLALRTVRLVAPCSAEDELAHLKVETIAKILQVTKPYVYDLINQEQLPCTRFGKYVRVPVAPFREWLQSRRDKSELDEAIPKDLRRARRRRSR